MQEFPVVCMAQLSVKHLNEAQIHFLHSQVCVSECPQENFVYLESVTLERAGQRQKAREKLICKYDVDPQVSTVCSVIFFA